MTTIMITGKTELFTKRALERVAKHYKVIITGQERAFDKDKDIRFFQVMPTDEKFKQLFDGYSIQAVWYVSGYADGGEGMFGEAQLLEQTFLECSRSRVEKLILLSGIDSRNFRLQHGENGLVTGKEYPDSRAFQAARMEELAEFLGEKTGTKTVILRLPYIADSVKTDSANADGVNADGANADSVNADGANTDRLNGDSVNADSFLGRIYGKMFHGEPVFFPYHAEDRVDFLSVRDLVKLLVCVTEETEDESCACFAVSGYRHSYGELEEILKTAEPETEVIYGNCAQTARIPDYPAALRKRYGFVPVDDEMENIESGYHAYVSEMRQSGHGLWERLKQVFGKAGTGIFKYAELFAVFLLAEFVSRYTSASIYFKFVDVRLLFIVIMGTMYGMKTGIFAALLECVVLVFSYAQIGIDGMQLFYNIENWIPFVIYIIAGSVTGYVKNKKTEELNFSRGEYSLLRSKYIFLSDVYHGAIENKGEYKRQILGYKDSFGKIFDAVQKLDTQLPECIFLEGLRVMEDILENHSVAIYTLDSRQRFGRLTACSNSLLPRLTKSIRLEEHPRMLGQVEKGEVWKNIQLEKDVPMYACSVFRDGKISLLVTIWEVDMQQYGMRYMNIFKILCGLVQTSFLRALDYQELKEREMYYPGTGVLHPDRFRQMFQLQEEMKAAGVADYVLLRFADRDMFRVGEALHGMIRATDLLGADENGFLYLLLVQMNHSNFRIVGDRLTGRGISYELTEKVG